MDLSALQTTLRQFAAERDWQPFHTPKNLAMALMVEAAELAEIFQWLTPEQSAAVRADPVLQDRIGDEAADVLLYLLQLADHTDVDLENAAARKLRKNASKHPPLRPGAPAGAAAESAVRTHVLVDWENVQPHDTDLHALVPDVTDVWLFHGPSQTRVMAHQASFGDRATPVRIARAGKNALDFHLSFYMGYIAARSPGARFVVVSNDKGYAPMLEHAVSLGFSARQVGFGPRAQAAAPAAARKRAPAKKATTGRAPSGRTTAAKKAAAEPAVAAAPQQAMPPARQRAPARKAVAAKPAAKATAKAAPVPKPAPSTAPAPRKAPAARKPPTARKPRGEATAAAEAVTAARKSAAAPSKKVNLAATGSAPAKAPATPKPSAARKAAAAPAAASVPPAPAAGRKTIPRDLDQAVRHVRASLARSTDLPARQARLQAVIRALLGPGTDDQRVQAVLARLVAGGQVNVDPQGAVRYRL